MGMIQYDPDVIREHATELYDAANSMVTAAMIRGGLLGGIVAAVVGCSIGRMSGASVEDWIGAVVGGLLGAVVGAFVAFSGAEAQAAQLRLQAQSALCQVEIEANTRLAAAREIDRTASSLS